VGSGGLTYLLNKDVRGVGKHALAFGGAVGGGMGLLSTLLQYLENRDTKKSIDEALVNDTKEASIKKSASDCGSHTAKPVVVVKKKVKKKQEKSSSLVDKLNLIKFDYTQPKQASLENLNTERFVKLLNLE